MADAFDRYVPEMIETRRRIHKRPELGWTEFETTAIVAKKLTELGFEIHLGREVVNPDAVLGRDPKAVEAAITRAREAGVPEELLSRMDGYTGCVGILDTGRPGPTLAFRHDMACRLPPASRERCTPAATTPTPRSASVLRTGSRITRIGSAAASS